MQESTPTPSSTLDRRAFCGALALCALAPACRRRAPALPVLGEVPPFTLTDEEGRPFSRDALAGRVWIASFFFTRCPTVCPRMMQTMKELQSETKSRAQTVHFLSFSVDPDNDTPPVLKAYRDRFGAEPESWRFLTGPFQAIRDVSVAGFKLALEGKTDPARADFGILHSSYLVLIDGAGKIRGYYDTSDAAARARLLDDAAALASAP